MDVDLIMKEAIEIRLHLRNFNRGWGFNHGHGTR
jgi:hypothetical protein